MSTDRRPSRLAAIIALARAALTLTAMPSVLRMQSRLWRETVPIRLIWSAC